MAVNYQYNYAEIDLATGMCIGVSSATAPNTYPNFIEIPVYDENYVLKYYIDGEWYEDAAGTIPWSSSLV